MTTDGEKARQVGLAHALAEFEQLLAKWNADEEPVDIAELTRLAIYEKP